MRSRNIDASEMIKFVLDVHEIHSIFTILLKTLSRPGDIHTFHHSLVEKVPPAVLPLMSLVSHRTPFCIVGEDVENSISALVENATGAVAVELEDAAYISFLRMPTSQEILRVRQGDALHPNHAAQISISIPGEIGRSGSEVLFQLSGPGVESSKQIHIPEFSNALVQHFQTRHELFPAGIDMWLVDVMGNIVGIPRSSSVHFSSIQGVK